MAPLAGGAGAVSNPARAVAGHAWHYMRFCGICGARPAEVLPVEVPRCRLHGGRGLRRGERMPRRGPPGGSDWSINLGPKSGRDG